jgi:hypothetical protein
MWMPPGRAIEDSTMFQKKQECYNEHIVVGTILIQKWLVVSTHTKQSENPLWGLENMI